MAAHHGIDGLVKMPSEPGREYDRGSLGRSIARTTEWTAPETPMIVTIACDNIPVSDQPIRWPMPRLVSISAVLGRFSILERLVGL
jgi:hypothetical protein